MKMNLILEIIFFIPLFFMICSISFSYLKNEQTLKNNTNQFSNNVFLFVLSAILIFITGFRSRDGLSFDYGNYEYIYLSFKDLSWRETFKNGKGEILFSIFYKLCGEITNYNIVPFMFIIAVFTIIPIITYFRNESKNAWFSLFLLLTIGSFWTCFNTSRQYLAAALYIFSYKYIQRKQFFKYLLSVCFISLIHMSTIVMIPFYWLLNIRLDFEKKALKSLVLMLFIIVGVIFATRIVRSVVPPSLMLVELMRDHNSPAQLIRPFAVLMLLLLNLRHIDLNSHNDNFIFNCTFFYFIIFSMTLSFKIFQRWSYFLVFPTLIAVPNIISRIKSKDERLFYYIVFLIFPLIYAVGTLSKTTYTFFWD